MSLLLAFSKFLNFSELLFCKVRKKNNGSSHKFGSKANELCVSSTCLPKRGVQCQARHLFSFPGTPIRAADGNGSTRPQWSGSLDSGSSYRGAHFLSHCLLVSEHRKLRSSGTKPASKHGSILHASFKTGRSRSWGTGKIQASIQSTPMESLPPLLTPPYLLYWFIYTCVLLLHREPE